MGCVVLPIVLGSNKKLKMNAEIVEAQIPLLVGTNSMVKGKAKLNFETMVAIFYNQEVKMHQVGAGHFCIDLMSDNISTLVNNIEEREFHIQTVLATIETLNEKQIKQLHHVFGHVSADRLEKFISQSGMLTDDVSKAIKSITSSCEACVKTKRKVPRPKVSIPRADAPNQIC